MFKAMFEAISGGILFSMGKFVARMVVRLGGTFLIAKYVLEPVYNYLMAAMQSSAAGDLGAWLELARIPECFAVLMSAYGVKSAQSFVFRRFAGS